MRHLRLPATKHCKFETLKISNLLKKMRQHDNYDTLMSLIPLKPFLHSAFQGTLFLAKKGKRYLLDDFITLLVFFCLCFFLYLLYFKILCIFVRYRF